MGDRSQIEWTDATWNPVTGCTKVSPGCDHCYAMRIATRFAGTPAYPRGFGVTLHPGRLDRPIRWKRPRRIFVNSMSDLFHSDIPDEYIVRVWDVMANAPQHVYQVLTKRHGRMRSLVASGALRTLPNVWLGVSVEDQKRAELRIPALLGAPASVRFLSCEPLLGPVNLHLGDTPGIDWVIVGGESGPGARPMQPDWARSLRDQCGAAGVPFHFKQWGDWSPDAHDGMRRVGKRAAGRDLDGRTT